MTICDICGIPLGAWHRHLPQRPVTAVPPRPAAPEWPAPSTEREVPASCICADEDDCPDCPVCTPPAAPDATAGDGLREVQAWIDDATNALRAATTISERMWLTGRVEGLHLASHDRLVGTAPALRDVLAAAARDAETTARLRAELADAVRLLNELAEDTDAIPCRYDHHGQCQEHSGGERCYDRDAHEFLKSVGIRRAPGVTA